MSELVYNLLIHADELDGGLWAEVEGLPGCFAQGDELSDLIESATEAIRMCADLPDAAEVKVIGHLVPSERLVIYANSDVSRGKYAAAAVHAALNHYGIDHGAVIVLGARAKQIEERCDLVIHDAGLTEVKPGTATAGIARPI